MEDHGRTILKALLSIKVKRERSLRLLFAAYLQQEVDLLNRKSLLLDQRQQHRESWRRHCGLEQQLTHGQFQMHKRTLAGHFEQDLALTVHLDQLQSEWQQLQVDKSEQQAMLRKNRLEQEKLRMILE